MYRLYVKYYIILPYPITSFDCITVIINLRKLNVRKLSLSDIKVKILSQLCRILSCVFHIFFALSNILQEETHIFKKLGHAHKIHLTGLRRSKQIRGPWLRKIDSSKAKFSAYLQELIIVRVSR